MSLHRCRLNSLNIDFWFSVLRNLDPLTETYGLSFYMQYLAHWPEYFQVAESPAGEIMGYGNFDQIPSYGIAS